MVAGVQGGMGGQWWRLGARGSAFQLAELVSEPILLQIEQHRYQTDPLNTCNSVYGQEKAASS
jgi:hypothetical protein